MSLLNWFKKGSRRNTSIATGEESDANSQREEQVTQIDEEQVIQVDEETNDQYTTKLIYFSSKTSNHHVIDNINRSFKNVQVFNDENKCIEYLKSITEKIFLIIDDKPSETLLQAIEPLKQIDSVFFHSASSDALDALAAIGSRPHSYLHYQCHGLDMLRDAINRSIDELDRQKAVFSMYNQKEKTIYNLSKERGSFLYYQLFKYLLKNLPKTYETKRTMIKTCQNYYRGNLSELRNIEEFDQTYRSSDAIVWFIMDTFLNRFINKTLRTQDLSLLYLFHYYILDLSQQLEFECEKLREKHKDPLKLYYAVQLSQEELINYQNCVGYLISNSEYLATTSDYSVAYNTLTKVPKQEGVVCVLIEYFVDFNMAKNTIIADVKQYSPFPEESQFLIDTGAIFQIDSCNRIKEDLWHIKLHATDENTAFIDEYIEYQKEKIAQSSIELFIGNLFLEMGEYDKAERYFDTLLTSSNPNDEEIACLFFNFGRTHRSKGDFSRAINCYNRAYQLHMNARPKRPASAGKTLNGVGVVYSEQGRQSKAEQCFKAALDLYKTSLPKDHVDVAGTLMNLGIIESNRKNFKQALSKYEQAKIIYDDSLPTFHPNRALLRINLGNTYVAMGNHQMALKEYEDALNIQKMSLPSDHPSIAQTLHNIATIHGHQENTNKAKIDLEHAQSIKNQTFSLKDPIIKLLDKTEGFLV